MTGRKGRTRRRRELTAEQLRRMLAQYGIYEKLGPNGEWGYYRADFEPIWRELGIIP